MSFEKEAWWVFKNQQEIHGSNSRVDYETLMISMTINIRKIRTTMKTKMTLMIREHEGQVATSSPHCSSSFVMANLSPQGHG